MQLEENTVKFIMSSLFYRSLPEPLMTYELHGEFIIPASKYMTVVQIEIFRCCAVVTSGALCECNFRQMLHPSKNTGTRNNKLFKNMF